MTASGYLIPIDPSQLANRFASAAYNYRFDREDEQVSEDEIESVPDEALAELFSTGDYESQVAPLLSRIPDREADLIELYYIHHKRQLDIAHMFGITQAAVSYRLVRGIERLRFLISVPAITDDEIWADLPEIFPATLPCPWCQPASPRSLSKAKRPTAKASKPGKAVECEAATACDVCRTSGQMLIDVAILSGMWATTCQSVVAKTLRLTQGRVRHRFFNAVDTLQAASDRDDRFEPYLKVFSSIKNKNWNALHEVKLPQWANRGKDECL